MQRLLVRKGCKILVKLQQSKADKNGAHVKEHLCLPPKKTTREHV